MGLVAWLPGCLLRRCYPNAPLELQGATFGQWKRVVGRPPREPPAKDAAMAAGAGPAQAQPQEQGQQQPQQQAAQEAPAQQQPPQQQTQAKEQPPQQQQQQQQAAAEEGAAKEQPAVTTAQPGQQQGQAAATGAEAGEQPQAGAKAGTAQQSKQEQLARRQEEEGQGQEPASGKALWGAGELPTMHFGGVEVSVLLPAVGLLVVYALAMSRRRRSNLHGQPRRRWLLPLWGNSRTAAAAANGGPRRAS